MVWYGVGKTLYYSIYDAIDRGGKHTQTPIKCPPIPERKRAATLSKQGGKEENRLGQGTEGLY